MKKKLKIALPVILFAAFVGYILVTTTGLSGAQYISPETFRGWLAQNRSIIIDVQPYAAYVKGHFPDSYATFAYPVKTTEQKEKLDALLSVINQSEKPVVLVCPGGITGAPNARMHLLSRGVPNERLFILKGGTSGWPWKNMLISGNGR